MILTIKNLIHLTTPQYLLIALVNPLVAYLLINERFPTFEIVPIIASFAFGILGFNTLNQISDIEIDRIDKPLRPIISKQVSIKEAALLSAIFYSLSLLISAGVNFVFLGIMAFFFIITFSYCHKGIYFKKYVWGSSFVGTLIYGVLPFISVTIISTKSFNPIFLVFIATLAAIIANTKDFEDLPGEKQHGIKSIQTILGFDRAAVSIVAIEGTIIILMGYLSFQGLVEKKFVYASILSFFLFIIFSYLFLREIRFIKYKHIAFSHTNNIEIKSIVTQSEASTVSLILGLSIEIIFGLTAVSVF